MAHVYSTRYNLHMHVRMHICIAALIRDHTKKKKIMWNKCTYHSLLLVIIRDSLNPFFLMKIELLLHEKNSALDWPVPLGGYAAE